MPVWNDRMQVKGLLLYVLAVALYPSPETDTPACEKP